MAARSSTLTLNQMASNDVTLFAVAIVCSTLGGCYFVNQPRLERAVHAHLAVGMLLQTAVGNASTMKFKCSGTGPVDCSRLRQSLMPYSCVERIRLYSAGMPPVVDAIEIPKIACAGL